MPTILEPFGIKVPASDLEPPAVQGIIDLGTSVNTALARPYVDLRASAATSITHNAAAYTKVALATTTHNDSDYFGVAASVVTVLADGLYDINVKSGFAAPGSPTAEVQFAISLNGLAFANEIAKLKIGIAVAVESEGTLTLQNYALVEGDTIQIGAYQFQTSASAAENTIADSRLLIRKVG